MRVAQASSPPKIFSAAKCSGEPRYETAGGNEDVPVEKNTETTEPMQQQRPKNRRERRQLVLFDQNMILIYYTRGRVGLSVPFLYSVPLREKETSKAFDKHLYTVASIEATGAPSDEKISLHLTVTKTEDTEPDKN